MSLDIDAILDRRQLRRKVSFWRIGALIALALAILAAFSAAGVFKNIGASGDHIARVSIFGTITEDRPLLEMLEKIKKDKTVKGVILSVNSPGGTTVGGESIYEAVRNISAEKPVVTNVNTLAASAGYMIASASDHIVARRSSIVGSIGVIFQYPQASELLDKIGVQIKEIKSSPLKAEPSPFHIPPPGAEAVIEELISDSYNWFVDLVTERRPLSRAEVLKLADGRIFSGDRSLKNKLIDAIGGESVAKEWLITEKGLDKKLKVKDWNPVRPGDNFLFSSMATKWLMGEKGSILDGIDKSEVTKNLPGIVPKRLFLDGLLSIWHK